jgi:hypothetical protein
MGATVADLFMIRSLPFDEETVRRDTQTQTQ